MQELIYLSVINLAHRTDRKQQCIIEIEKTGAIWEPHFFEAKYIQESGARGCALSHAMALSEFLFKSEKPFAMIMEDDFSLSSPGEFESDIKKAIEYNEYWDVFLLGHNLAIPIKQSKWPAHFKVINSQTTPGYIVSRKYASELIKVFFKSAELLLVNELLPAPHRDIAKHFYCCDILWKELQIKDNFLTTFPSVVCQRESYSDIERAVVNYGV